MVYLPLVWATRHSDLVLNRKGVQNAGLGPRMAKAFESLMTVCKSKAAPQSMYSHERVSTSDAARWSTN